MTVMKGLAVSDYLSYKRDLPAPGYSGFNCQSKASEIASQQLQSCSNTHTTCSHHNAPFHPSFSYLKTTSRSGEKRGRFSSHRVITYPDAPLESLTWVCTHLREVVSTQKSDCDSNGL